MKISLGSLLFCGAVLLGVGHPAGAETSEPTTPKVRSRTIDETSAPSTLKERSRIVNFLAGEEGELVRSGDVLCLSEDIRRVGDDYFTRSSLDIFDQNGHLVIQIPPTLKQSSTLDTIRGKGWSIEQGDEIKRITNLTVDEKAVHVKVQQVYKQEVIEITSSYPIEVDAYYNLWDDIKKGVEKASDAIKSGLEKAGDVISNTFDGYIDQITKAGAAVQELTHKIFICDEGKKWKDFKCTEEEKKELHAKLQTAQATLKGLEAKKPDTNSSWVECLENC